MNDHSEPAFMRMDNKGGIIKLPLPREFSHKPEVKSSQQIVDDMIDKSLITSIYTTRNTPFMPKEMEVRGNKYQLKPADKERTDVLTYQPVDHPEEPVISFAVGKNGTLNFVQVEYDQPMEGGNKLETIHSFTLWGHPAAEILTTQLMNTYNVSLADGVTPYGFSVSKTHLFDWNIGSGIETPNPLYRAWYEVVAHDKGSGDFNLGRFYQVAENTSDDKARIINEHSAQNLPTPNGEYNTGMGILEQTVQTIEKKKIIDASEAYLQSQPLYQKEITPNMVKDLLLEEDKSPKRIRELRNKLLELITKSVKMPEKVELTDSVSVSLITDPERDLFSKYGIGSVDIGYYPFDDYLSFLISPLGDSDTNQILRYAPSRAKGKIKAMVNPQLLDKLVTFMEQELSLPEASLSFESRFRGTSGLDFDILREKIKKGEEFTQEELLAQRKADRDRV